MLSTWLAAFLLGRKSESKAVYLVGKKGKDAAISLNLHILYTSSKKKMVGDEASYDNNK